MDHAPFVVAATSLLLGPYFPVLRPLGGAALALVVLYVLAAIGRVSLPRPGRRRIATYACHELPLGFALRHQGRTFVFQRPLESGCAELTARYSVYALREGDDLGPWLERQRRPGSAYLGDLPAGSLRFHHATGSYVGRGVLGALRRLERRP